MKQRLLLCIILFLCIMSSAFSQTYRNEWIDFSKTYYRFTVVKNGVYRINTNELPSAIQGADAGSYQLWKNGVQIPIYTSITSGVFSSNDYIEFWGQMNDGKADSSMYLNPSYQTNKVVSIETDSSTYFLTVNPGSSNLRLSTAANDVVTGSPLPLPYFIDTLEYGFRDQLWQGYAQVISGEYVLSSSYDKNEGWTTNKFSNSSFVIGGLKAYKGSGAPDMQFMCAGGADNIFYNTGTTSNPIYHSNDVMTTLLNGVQIEQRTVGSLDSFIVSAPSIPVNLVSSNDDLTLNVSTQNSSLVLLGEYKLVYPRTFDFTGNQSFSFDLPANPSGTYLEISNFVTGGYAPVLIDVTNGNRYTCVVAGNVIKVKLLPTSNISKCILYSTAPTFASHITNYTTRKFNDYKLAANQGDFIFIASSMLNSGANNQVEAYRSYRASAAGGSYNAKTYDADELTDQFGYGIYKHPLGLRNFIQFARTKFPVLPKYVLILGHGVNFRDFYAHQGEANANVLNMVPTWGNPASDVLLSAASINTPVPSIPIGRVSAINTAELKAYVDKIKEYDLLQTNTINDQANQDWKKKSLFIVGSGSDVNALLSSYMESYIATIKDTLVGADAPIFGESGTNLTVASAAVKNLISNGIPLLTYFGHASLTSLDFNISDPNDYTNTNGKYSIFSVGGCDAGNFYNYDDSRITNNAYTISEKFTLAPERGAVGFVSSTHFGVVSTLDAYNKQFFIATGTTKYGKSIGEINQSAFGVTWAQNTGDYFTRLTLEQTTLHGDPSVKLYTAPKPDYDMEMQNIFVSPNFISSTDDSFKVAVHVHNIGKAINDSVKVKLQWKDPTGKVQEIGTYKLKGVRYIDSSISAKLHIIGNTQQGTNYIIATIDPDNVINEVAENNNTATLAFQISPDEIRPVYPYPLSIVNTPTFKLVASTVDPYQASRTYKLDMDTTELFNSPKLKSTQVTQVGGEVEFAPPITTFENNLVYYWRVAPIVNGVPVNYRKSSFLYNTGFGKGWSQSHLYQHLKSSTSEITIDSVKGQFDFGKISNSLQVNNAYYFGDGLHGGIQNYDFSTSVNGNAYIYGSCSSAAITFFVFDTIHFSPWSNPNPSKGLYGTYPNNCGAGKQNNFTFQFFNGPKDRKAIMDFMNMIPNGYYVVAKMEWPGTNYPELVDSSYPSVWRKDTLIYGSGQCVPDYLIKQGFKDIDQLTYPRLWNFIYKKNDQAHFIPTFTFTQNLYDKITTTAECFSTDTVGSVSSPVFGPAKAWSQVHWGGHPLESAAPFPDSVILQIIAIDKNGNPSIKFNLDRSNPNFDISSISADVYPNIQLKLITKDTLNATPWQLDSWRLDYTPVPEGVLAPNLYSVSTSTTNAVNQPYKFGVAFKNVSEMTMNPLKLKLKLIDVNGNERLINLPNTKSLISGDTAQIYFEIPTDTLNGIYNIYLAINSDSAQTEQYFFNDFLYKQFVSGTPLPVNFLNFQAIPNSSNVSLQWQVTNEQGANYYVVERSVDGINFTTIGKVAAFKNNALMNTYGLLDASPVNGKNYYRIRILNQDGTSEYSEIRVIGFGKENMVKIYPNPVKNVLNVSIPSDGKLITLILTNATGQKMMQTTTLGSTQLGLSQYAAGIYYLQVKDANGSTTFRVEKQ